MTIGVNGSDYGWGSITFKFDGLLFTGYTKIAYAHRITRTLGYSAGKHHAPTHRSPGKYEVDPLKITGYKLEVAQMKAELAKRALDGVSYGTVEFEGVVQFGEAGVILQTDLERLKWGEDGHDHSESPDLLMTDFTLSCMRIIEYDQFGNVMTLPDSSQGLPQ